MSSLSESTGLSRGFSEPEKRAIEAQLERIIQARSFKASDRLRSLLRFVVQASLEDRSDDLTQWKLAEAVFQRGSSFDPERDPVVRVEMRKLRQALELYYLTGGIADPLRITIPPGSYVPRVERTDARAELEPTRETPHEADVIAILAFTPHGDKPELCKALADGITEELSMLLQRIPEISLVPSIYSKTGNDPQQTLQDLREKSRARFVVEGSTRCSGERVRITARLHDIREGAQIWSNRYDWPIDPANLFDTQEDIARLIVAEALDMYSGKLGSIWRRKESSDEAQSNPEQSATAAFQHYLHTTSETSYQHARQALEATINLSAMEPAYLIAMHADLRRSGYSLGFTDDDDPIDEVIDTLRELLKTEPDCLQARISLCYALLHKHDKAGLLQQVDAVLSDPTTPDSFRSDAAVALGFSGEWDKACSLLEPMTGSNCVYPQYFKLPLFLRAYQQEDFEQAAEVAVDFRKADLFVLPLFSAAVWGKLNQAGKAERDIEHLLTLRPNIQQYARRYLSCFILDEALIADIFDGLERAGLAID